MKVFKTIFTYLLIITVTLILISTIRYDDNFTSIHPQIGSDTTIWIAPDSVNSFVNPFEVDEEYLVEGEMIYKKNCRSCHGRLGDGKGAGAADLSTIPTNFTVPEFLEQSDGSIFWKIFEGKDDMESYKKKLSEDDIWLTVTYIKTFAQTE